MAESSAPTPKARRPRTGAARRRRRQTESKSSLSSDARNRSASDILTFSDAREALAAEPPPKVRSATPQSAGTHAGRYRNRCVSGPGLTPDPVNEFASIDQPRSHCGRRHTARRRTPPTGVRPSNLSRSNRRPCTTNHYWLTILRSCAKRRCCSSRSRHSKSSPPMTLCRRRCCRRAREPRLPAFLEPPAPRTPAATASHSPVWPIGVAAVIGVAVGFGFGYTVAIRDRRRRGSDGRRRSPLRPTSWCRPRPSHRPNHQRRRVSAAGADRSAGASSSACVLRTRYSSARRRPGARVFVDGKDRGQTAGTIARPRARSNIASASLRDGYTTAERRVVLTSAQPSQSLSVPLAREPRARGKPCRAEAEVSAAAPPAPSATGALVIETRPQGASVLVDGRAVGTTPLTISAMFVPATTPSGLERDGYRPWTGLSRESRRRAETASPRRWRSTVGERSHSGPGRRHLVPRHRRRARPAKPPARSCSIRA